MKKIKSRANMQRRLYAQRALNPCWLRLSLSPDVPAEAELRLCVEKSPGARMPGLCLARYPGDERLHLQTLDCCRECAGIPRR